MECPLTLEADQDYGSTKMKVRASEGDSMPFEIRSSVRQRCAISPTLFNCIIDWILCQALQDYSVVQPEANVHVPDLAYADDIMILSSSQLSSLVSSVKPSCLMVRRCGRLPNSRTLA